MLVNVYTRGYVACSHKKKKIVQTIVSNLQEFVTEELLYATDIDSIEADEPLLTTGVLDSLGSAQLMVFVEETYKIRLKPAELTLENFNTLDSLASLVVRHTGE